MDLIILLYMEMEQVILDGHLLLVLDNMEVQQLKSVIHLQLVIYF